MSDWEKHLNHKRSIANFFYLMLFALTGIGILGGFVWLLGKIGGHW